MELIISVVSVVAAFVLMVFGGPFLRTLQVWWSTRGLIPESRSQVVFWRYLHNTAFSEQRFREAKLAKAKELTVLSTGHPIVDRWSLMVPPACVAGFLEEKTDEELDSLIYALSTLSKQQRKELLGVPHGEIAGEDDREREPHLSAIQDFSSDDEIEPQPQWEEWKGGLANWSILLLILACIAILIFWASGQR